MVHCKATLERHGVVGRHRGGTRNTKVDEETTAACVAIVEQHVG